jgi:hypothetical protein
MLLEEPRRFFVKAGFGLPDYGGELKHEKPLESWFCCFGRFCQYANTTRSRTAHGTAESLARGSLYKAGVLPRQI